MLAANPASPGPGEIIRYAERPSQLVREPRGPMGTIALIASSVCWPAVILEARLAQRVPTCPTSCAVGPTGCVLSRGV